MIILLATILVILPITSIQSIDAENNSKYIVSIQVEVRNVQNELVSVTESRFGEHIQHKIPNHVFDSSISQKEIVIIDGIEYEKVQFSVTSKSSDMTDAPPAREYDNSLQFSLCGISDNDKLSCITLQSAKYWVLTDEGDTTTSTWSVLRVVD